MSIITGDSGMEMLDGQGGNIALMVKTGVLKILEESGFSYLLATVTNKQELNTGSVTYQLPEIIQTQDYGTGNATPQQLTSSTIKVSINLRRTASFTYELFDYSRLGSWTSIVGMIAGALGAGIKNDLNAHFWDFVITQLNLTNGTLRAQNLTLSNLLPDLTNIGAETLPVATQIQESLYKIQLLYNKINKTYNMRAMGIKKSELMLFLAPEADTTIRQAYFGQPNSLAERQIAEDLVGYKMGGGMTYYIDKMLNNNIPAGSSFSKDKALDTTGFAGVLLHNEAIAMPFNFEVAGMVQNLQNLNPIFITKYQFGLGMLRPNLIYSITKTAPNK